MVQLYNNDCRTIIPTLHDNSINCIITSPPYNVEMKYNTYEDNVAVSDYLKFLEDVFSSLFYKLVAGGRLCINIGDGKNGKIPISSDVIQICKNIGYLCCAHIIWNKNTTSNRTAWGSWLSPINPSYPTPFEHILIFSKDSQKLSCSGVSDLTKEEFVTYANSLWTFSPERNQKKFNHPAMFPEELPYRLIKMNTFRQDIVLDPFMGTGTTGLVCKKLDRQFIGIEMDKQYYNTAKERINNYGKNKLF